MNDTPKYVDERKVSEITGRALPTLRNDRHNRRGIPYCKVGRSVRYSLADVVSYMEFRKIVPEDNTNPIKVDLRNCQSQKR
jgi:hypothetical protein